MGVPFVKEFDDLAESIASPNPNRPISNAVGQFGRQVCDRISARPDIFAPTVLQSPLKAVCQPYWDGQGYDGPVEKPPFTGGQCAGVTYVVEAEFWNPTLQQWGNFDSVGIGPQAGPILSISPELVGTCNTGSGFPGRTVRWNVLSGPGPSLNSQVLSACRPTNPSTGLPYRGLRARRTGGGPDVCGDPPPEFRPGGNPAPDPGPLPPGTGPQFDIRGNPFFVLPPTLEISPGFNFEFPIGEINLGSGTGNGSPSPPLPGDEEPGTGSGVGGGEDDFGEPPDGERWVGCCVTITNRPVGSGTIPQAEPESIYPRIIGNVRLKFRGAGGASEYDTPLENRQKTTCVWEPVRGLEPVGVRVNLLPGYAYSYRPYSVPLEQ